MFDIEEPLYYRDIDYVQGVVYCSLPCAMIGALETALKHRKILRYPPFDDAKNRLMYDYLIDSGSGNNNNNLLIVISQTKKISEREMYAYTVYRFDPLGMKWSQVESDLLNNKSLFLGYTS